MTRVLTPEQVDAAMARVAEGRNPEYPLRANRPTPLDPADLIARAEAVLARIERLIERYEAGER
jgi:hypothetical protein